MATLPTNSLEALVKFRTKPKKYYTEVLGVTLEDYQEEITQALADHDRIAISACHDVGKSFLMARAVLWFGNCFPNCKIITTAPTSRQVEKILWSEINAAYASAKVPLGGRMLTSEWKLAPDWFALGFSPKNEAQLGAGEGQGTQSSFQGFHAPWILVIFDEATGVPKNVWTMAEGLLTSGRVKFICIGNPTSKQSEFYKCFSDRAWHKIKLTCFDSPNLRVNGITNKYELEKEIAYTRTLSDNDFLEHVKKYKTPRQHLLTLKWVVTKAAKWGMSHPLTLSKILGEFPEDSDNVKISLSMVEAAMNREYIPKEGDRDSLGVDVARFGTDSTVLTRIKGKKVLSKKAHAKLDIVQVVGEVLGECRTNGWPNIIVVDETGLGAGVVDMLKHNQLEREKDCIPSWVEIRGVQFGEGIDDEDDDANTKKYANLKARMYDLLATEMQELALLREDIYLEELPTILYKFDKKGRMIIESKDEYKKRTGLPSPDHSDSLALAVFGLHDFAAQALAFPKNQPTANIRSLAGGFKSRHDKW